MTVQTMSVNYRSFVKVSEKSVNSVTEQSFDSFLTTEGTGKTDIKSENKPVRDSVSQNGRGTVETNETKQIAESSEKLPAEQLDNAEADVVVKESSGLPDEMKTEEQTLPDDVLAEILGVLNEFVQVLQNEFQVEEQQLLDSAAAIQFGVTDFFDSDRIKELFLQVNGAEASELLTDENLYKSLEDIQDMLSEHLDTSELYQILNQEGFSTDVFDVAAFENQIRAFIEGVPEENLQTVELVINFDESLSETEGTVKVMSQNSENDVLSEEIVQGDENGFENDEQNSSESNQGGEQAGLFLQKLVSVVKDASADRIQKVQNGFELHDIAAQIIEQVKIHIRPENTRMEIQLNPEQLGRVELEISSKNGELSAKMNVQNDQVKEAVESQMQVLRETLEAQGLKVENIEVTVAEFGFRFQDEQGSAQQFQQRQRRNTIDLEDAAETEELSSSDVSEVMKELNGNSVDYVA